VQVPQFFSDRSLGDHEVPETLRAAGWLVVSMRGLETLKLFS
jgi:hypothetical protein